MRKVFNFPDTVNEVSARLVAAGVVALCALILVTGQMWLVAILAYGFLARVASGPRFSPWAQLVTRVLTPSLPFEAKIVPGPPKRFAQGIGATLSVTAAISYFAFGNETVALVLVAMIAIAASLEAALGFCLGCKIFAQLMKAGVISEDVCEACNNLNLAPSAS